MTALRPAMESVGLSATFRKTIAESDIYLYAGITGDFDPLHVDSEYCRAQTSYGERIAQGGLIIGFMMAAAANAARGIDAVLPSLGFDRVRHTGPVFIGDTINVRYSIDSFDAERERGTADIVVENQRGKTVCVAKHVFKILSAK